MTPPFLLIAEREFRAYVATMSFWVALAVGPLAIGGAVALSQLAGGPTGPVRVSIEAPTATLYRYAADALADTARLEGRAVVVLPPHGPTGAARLRLSTDAKGRIVAGVTGSLALSDSGRLLIQRTLERDVALARLGEAVPDEPRRPAEAEQAQSAALASAPAIARFALVMMLWLTLTGSLGMLLQAVVRERANRALESLLAAARPADVVVGKLVGVGAVSLLVLGAWLGSGALLAPLAPRNAGLGPALLEGLGDPVALARAGLIYVLAFGFYGLVTVALGASARDTAQAQNLSRPMFALLLAAFFAALATAGGAGRALAWLTYVPPFTPFMLLLTPAGSIGLVPEAVALGLLALAAMAAGRVAISRLDLTSS